MRKVIERKYEQCVQEPYGFVNSVNSLETCLIAAQRSEFKFRDSATFLGNWMG